MATLGIDVIKDIPGYKVILKAVLRTQIQQLVEQLSEHTDEESVILTANVSDGTLSHLGSDNGKLFLDTYDDVKKTFLGFCLRRHHDKPVANEITSVLPKSKLSSTRYPKLHSKVVSKSRHSPYQRSMPQTNFPSGVKAGTSDVIAKDTTYIESKEETSSQSKSEADRNKSESYMDVRVKEEPEDVTEENSQSSVEEHTSDKQKDFDEMVRSLNERSFNENVQLAQGSGVKSKLQENSKVANTPLDWEGYSDSMTDTAGQWADNSDLMSYANEQAGFHETFQGQNDGVVSTNTAEGADMPVYFESTRGGTKMSYNGFVYNEDRQGKSRIYWRCESRKCKGRTSDSTSINQCKDGKEEFVQNINVMGASTSSNVDAAGVSVSTLGEQNEFQSNDNDSNTSDTEVYDEPCSRDDSIKDYLSEDENKLNTTNSDTDIDVDDSDKILAFENDSSEKAIAVNGNNKGNVEVMQVCHQTIDKMTHCVARAISEERKQSISVQKSPSEICSKAYSPSSECVNESNNKITKEETDSVAINDENGENNETNESDLLQTYQDVEKKSETADDDLRDKSYKVLAIWNEIANDSNEASSEVLYDLIADKLKHKLEERKSVERQSQEENQNRTPNVPASEAESLQTEINLKPDDTENVDEKRTEYHSSENFKKRECSEESVQTDQEMFDSEKEIDRSVLQTITSGESDPQNRSRQSSGTQTSETVSDIERGDVSGHIESELPDLVCEFPRMQMTTNNDATKSDAVSTENASKEIITNSENTSHERQHENNRQVESLDSKNVIDSVCQGDVAKENKITHEQETKTHNIQTKTSASVVIGIDASANPTKHKSDIKTSRLSTPVKQVESKQNSGSTTKQLKTPQASVSKNKQNVKPATSNKPNKSFIDNLISKGVPIIIPDDDEDDEEEIHEKDDFMPSPRSTAFEMKSKQYHDEIEIKSKRISHVDKRQSFVSYSPQASSQMTQNSVSAKRTYQQYSPQLQQQYQYQDYYSQQQYGNQHVAAQEFFTPKVSSPLVKQQLFSPPKNMPTAAKMSGVSQKAIQMKSRESPLRDMPLPSHHFSPPSTPTTPKGSPYFKQSYITPTKQQQMPQGNQLRINQTQSPMQKTSFQQQIRFSPVAKRNLPSGTTIVIDDDPVVTTKKALPAVKNQQPKQIQTYIVRPPPILLPAQPQQSVPQPVAKPLHPVLTLPVSAQEQLTQLNVRSLDNKSLQGTMSLPVISNVASVSEIGSYSKTGVQMQQTKSLPSATKPSSATPYVDPVSIRQANERTPVKRTRSDDTMTSPSQIIAEPTIKRRHTSADDSANPFRHSADLKLEPPSNSHIGQTSSEGQVSPSKIPPKLEIDIDDVPGVLPEPSNQVTALKSPPVLTEPSLKAKEEKPVIPIAPKISSELTSFSPPVSPSTRRLHSTPATRSKTPVGMSGNASASDSDSSSVTPQESVPQSMKKFGCGDCGKSYTTKAALNQHFRKHTQERPFECDVCGKHYSQKGYLKKHIHTHFETQEK